jgi:hypothetical protein
MVRDTIGLAMDDMNEASKPGDKARCRYCTQVLYLKRWKILADGETQVFHWTNERTGTTCNGRQIPGSSERTFSEPVHRPNTARTV